MGSHFGLPIFASSDYSCDLLVQDDLLLRQQAARDDESFVSLLIFSLYIFTYFTLPSVFPETHSLLNAMWIFNQQTSNLQFPHNFLKMNYSSSTDNLLWKRTAEFLPQPLLLSQRFSSDPLTFEAFDIGTLRKQAWTLGAWTAFEYQSSGIGRNVKLTYRERAEKKVFEAGAENLTDLRIEWEDAGKMMLPGWSFCRAELQKKYGHASGADVISWICMYAERQNYPQSCMGRIPVLCTSLAIGAYLADGALQVSSDMTYKDGFDTLDAFFGSTNNVTIPVEYYEKKLSLALKSLRCSFVLSYFPIRYADLFGKQKNQHIVNSELRHFTNLELLSLKILSTGSLKTINKPYQTVQRLATTNSPSFFQTMPVSSIVRAIISVTSAEKRRAMVGEMGVRLPNTSPLSTVQYQTHILDFLQEKKVLKMLGKMKNPRTRRKFERCTFNKFDPSDNSDDATTARSFLESLGLNPTEYFQTLG